MDNIVIRPATAADVSAFYETALPQKSMRAYVADKDGEILAIAGIYRDSGRFVAFSHMKEGMASHKKAIVRGIREVMKMIDNANTEVLAICQSNRAAKLLKHLGFAYMDDVHYGSLYKWQK